MAKITQADLYNINKYYDLDEGIKEIIPEVYEEDDKLSLLCDKVHWARHNLRKYLESLCDEQD